MTADELRTAASSPTAPRSPTSPRGCRRSAPADLEFSAEELAAIDEHAVDGGMDLWEAPPTE